MSASTQIDDYIHQDEFAARLRQLLKSYGSPGALAKAIGRSEGAVRKWMRGKSEPNVTDLRAICQKTNTNVTWLVTGMGNPAWPTEIGEEPLRYPATSKTPLDYGLLENIMDAVDQELSIHGVEIASTKRSAMVATLYELFLGNKSIERDTVLRLVKLAG